MMLQAINHAVHFSSGDHRQMVNHQQNTASDAVPHSGIQNSVISVSVVSIFN